jgi:Ca2+-binding RTX toxin-like protein
MTMALDPNITGTDQDDYLVATPGTNVIDAGAGNDMIETVDGDNTIFLTPAAAWTLSHSRRPDRINMQVCWKKLRRRSPP